MLAGKEEWDMQGKDAISGGGGVLDRGTVNINRLHTKNVIIVA